MEISLFLQISPKRIAYFLPLSLGSKLFFSAFGTGVNLLNKPSDNSFVLIILSIH